MSSHRSLSLEQDVIETFFEPLTHIGHQQAPKKETLSDSHFTKKPRKPLSFGLNDDAALAQLPENRELVLSKDLLVEGVHFIGSENASLIAMKALRTNLSDIAAKGSTPYGYLLGLSLNDKTDRSWLESFALGLKKDQTQFNITLLGGDLVRQKGPVTISITILGLAEPGSFVTRDGAGKADIIYVTGTIGDAALGLELAKSLSGETETVNKEEGDHDWIADLDKKQVEFLISRYQIPQPRCDIAPEIARFCTSSMDISDGLALDSQRLCAASGKGCDIYLKSLPLSPGVKKIIKHRPDLISGLVSGGDDYEILCTVPKKLANAFEQACHHKNTDVTPIGHIHEGEYRLIDLKGDILKLSSSGYSHL